MTDMMNRLGLAAMVVMAASAAGAQTRKMPVIDAGAASAAARMQAQGYTDIHNLHRETDGNWTGDANRNGVPTTVTTTPDGKVTSR